ncbi:telomere repeat-binding protein 2-like [Silene latifolia]|uniref:telomere repeat-binding protein 2-like n=1 Tax=Silene latifolia TaxID=37657 RepID=UPI003D780B38
MLQKRLDYGYNGFQVPFVPRAPRSSRKRSLVPQKGGDDQLCAIDVLATVAGKILLEGESSQLTAHGTESNHVEDIVMEENEVVEHCDQGSDQVVSPSLTMALGLRGLDQDRNLKEVVVPSSGTSVCPSFSHTKIDLNGSDSHKIEDPVILDGKPPPMVHSDSSVKLALFNDHYPCSSQSPSREDNVNVVCRDDDDENFSECIRSSTLKTARSAARIGDRRIRKLLASKYWKMASKARDGDLSYSDVRNLYHSKKTGYKRLRSQRVYPFKKRRLYHYSSLSSSYAAIGFEGVHNYPGKAIGTPTFGFGKAGVNGPPACVAGQSKTSSSRESPVKLRIKSFRVPELFIDMPETATIGSLKRTVMEAVSGLIGGELRVEMLLQGKEIRDDNRTLLQSGICNVKKSGSVGFSLEPTPSQVGEPVFSESNSLVLSRVSSDLPQAESRCPINKVIHQGSSHISADHVAANLSNFMESDHDSAPSPADLSAEEGTVGPRALVALPEGTPQALSMVHPHLKSKCSDMGPRRIRRPFSVSEVEALVLAVEKLGTGRWRDVKILAFDNVKHRTYVDLKDKWKTLVHTARIAPQQRRGEPVPQELLDRVLAAHGYWAQQQAKQPPSATCLL